jgi:hypothetical protein
VPGISHTEEHSALQEHKKTGPCRPGFPALPVCSYGSRTLAGSVPCLSLTEQEKGSAHRAFAGTPHKKQGPARTR